MSDRASDRARASRSGRRGVQSVRLRPQPRDRSRGDATIVWTRSVSHPDVLASHRPAGGDWGDRVVLGRGFDARVEADRRGRVTAVWSTPRHALVSARSRPTARGVPRAPDTSGRAGRGRSAARAGPGCGPRRSRDGRLVGDDRRPRQSAPGLLGPSAARGGLGRSRRRDAAGSSRDPPARCGRPRRRDADVRRTAFRSCSLPGGPRPRARPGVDAADPPGARRLLQRAGGRPRGERRRRVRPRPASRAGRLPARRRCLAEPAHAHPPGSGSTPSTWP